MSPLRARMIEDMKLAGLAANLRKCSPAGATRQPSGRTRRTEPDADPQAPPSARRCLHCQTGHLTLLRRLIRAGGAKLRS